jgi:hypothetical protein
MFPRHGLFLSSIFGSSLVLPFLGIRTCVSIALETSKAQGCREIISTVLRPQLSTNVTNSPLSSFSRASAIASGRCISNSLTGVLCSPCPDAISSGYETTKNDGKEKLTEIAVFGNGQGDTVKGMPVSSPLSWVAAWCSGRPMRGVADSRCGS